MTKRGGTANYSVSASRAVGDGSGHSSPSHLGQFCGRDDGGHRRFPPGKPTPEGSPSELEEKAAYSFAKKRNSTCKWGNTKWNRAYKSAFRYQMSWPQPKCRERHFQLSIAAQRGSYELVTAAVGSVSLGAAAAQTLCGSSCRRC